MGWVKLDDDLLDHPKMLAAIAKSDEGVVHFWVKGTQYARKHLTDGRLPSEALPTFTRKRDHMAYVDALVSAGLWDRADGGAYLIHDYLEFYESRAVTLAKLEKKKSQLRGWRERQKRNEVDVKSDFNPTSTRLQSDSGIAAKLLPESESESESIPPMPPKGGGPPPVEPEPLPPEGAADVAWFRALRLAEAKQPDAIGYDQRLRPDVVNAMAGRWKQAKTRGETWAAYVARLDADVLGWVSSVRGTEQAKFCVGWPWRAFLARPSPHNGPGGGLPGTPPPYHRPFPKQPWEAT